MRQTPTKGKLREPSLASEVESPDSEKDLCLVYGNCQAEPLRVLLAASPAFASSFRTVPIPPTHLITAAELATVQSDLLPQTSLLVFQRVRPGYRDLPLGSEEIARLTPDRCTMVGIPDLYYQGLFPFQVTFPRRQWQFAPLTLWHDLRFMYCASMGWDAATASDWLAGYTPPVGALRQIAEDSAAELARREASLDVKVAARVTAPSAQSFFTIHHPTNQALSEVVRGIHDTLGLPYSPNHVGTELLGHLRTPVEPSVVAALGLDLPPATTWNVDGKQYSIDSLMATHLAWYGQNRALLRTGLEEHAARLAALGLDAG